MELWSENAILIVGNVLDADLKVDVGFMTFMLCVKTSVIIRGFLSTLYVRHPELHQRFAQDAFCWRSAWMSNHCATWALIVMTTTTSASSAGEVECIIAARRGTPRICPGPLGRYYRPMHPGGNEPFNPLKTIWFLSITATVAPGRFRGGKVMTESAVNRPIDR